MGVIDMRRIEKKYAGQWVALNETRTKAVGHGASIEEALAQAKKRGIRDPILTRIPTENFGYLL